MEYVREIGETVFEQAIWPHRQAFLERGWIRIAGYFEGQTIESDDGWVAEVDHEIDLEAGVYRYPNPNWRGSTVVRPIEEITFYALCIERFLNDLCSLLGIDPQHRPSKSDVVLGHLWELGRVQVGTTQHWARIFLGRLNHGTAHGQIKPWLDDEVCPGQSILLVHKVSNPPAFGEHVERCLSDLLDIETAHTQFRADKLQRILIRNMSAVDVAVQDEYLTDNHIKLKHLPAPMELSTGQVQLIRQAWGAPTKHPPIMSWSEINKLAKTGYASFDNAFGDDPGKRALIFTKVKRAQYQLRRSVV
ncbi:MAG: hypothetical protein IPN53_14380 [Comamonadaceae bacterium]|nr:hypothetical protein [Comamonadaceae bacterium]